MRSGTPTSSDVSMPWRSVDESLQKSKAASPTWTLFVLLSTILFLFTSSHCCHTINRSGYFLGNREHTRDSAPGIQPLPCPRRYYELCRRAFCHQSWKQRTVLTFTSPVIRYPLSGEGLRRMEGWVRASRRRCLRRIRPSLCLT